MGQFNHYEGSNVTVTDFQTFLNNIMQKTDQNEEKSKKACCILYVIELEIFTADRRTMEFS